MTTMHRNNNSNNNSIKISPKQQQQQPHEEIAVIVIDEGAQIVKEKIKQHQQIVEEGDNYNNLRNAKSDKIEKTIKY